MYLLFGGFAAAYAVVGTGDLRWATGALALVNFYVAWSKTSLVTIVFDRPGGVVTCGERRPLLAHEAELPLREFLGAQRSPSLKGRDSEQLGLATREGRLIPIAAKVAPEVSADLAKTIDDWLEGKHGSDPTTRASNT